MSYSLKDYLENFNKFHLISRNIFKKYEFGAIILSWSWLFRFTPTEEEKIEEKRKQLISEADSLFRQNKHRDLCNLLSHYKVRK